MNSRAIIVLAAREVGCTSLHSWRKNWKTSRQPWHRPGRRRATSVFLTGEELFLSWVWHPWPLANQRPVSRSFDYSQPIRGRGHTGRGGMQSLTNIHLISPILIMHSYHTKINILNRHQSYLLATKFLLRGAWGLHNARNNSPSYHSSH